MRRNLAIVGLLTLALAATVAGAGCRAVKLEDTKYGRSVGRVTDETATIAPQGASSMKADLTIGVGRLALRGAGSNALDARFTYQPLSWKPVVDYSVQDGVGTLHVRQPRSGASQLVAKHNDWDVSLPESMPIDLAVHFGVGTGTLDLTRLNVRSLDAEMGTGESTIDLSGARTSNVDGSIEVGVGAVTIRVPDDVGVAVTGSKDGVGDLVADGFTSQGDEMVNSQYGKSPVTIRLNVRRGVGEVRIVTVPTAK